tara:strand:- start:87 stop:404 length:318 start_codon:yes stop_codon:yes gene_type:complete
MKITDKEIKKIIREVLNEQSEFGKTSVTRTDATKNLRQRTRDAVSQTGVDNMERGIIQQVEANLAKLADITNLRSGNTFAFLKKLNKLIEKEIEKIEGGGQKDEK